MTRQSKTRPPSVLRSVLLTGVSLLSALVLTGCGTTAQDPEVATAGGAGDSQDTAGETDAAADVPDEERMRQFAACMREHGVDMPDPEPGGGQVRVGSDMAPGDRTAMDEAMNACRSLMPNGGERPELSQEDLERARAMAACMREHGVDVPDPDPDGGGVLIERGESGPPPDESAMRAAVEACRHLGGESGDGGITTHSSSDGSGGTSGGGFGGSSGGGG